MYKSSRAHPHHTAPGPRSFVDLYGVAVTEHQSLSTNSVPRTPKST